jgi:subtilase family serine protease
MQNYKSVLIALSVLAVLLFSSISLLSADASYAPNISAAKSRVGFGLNAVFDASSLSSSQPSPYCHVAGGTILIMCYTPQDIKVAYHYPSHLDGSGQTIVIVDAFGSPTVQSDLNTFDTQFGLPATTIQIVCQGGVCPKFNPSDSDQVGWTQETTLDTQYSHAMAPGAHIVLFVASSDDDLTLEQAVQSAVKMFPHSIISQSFGDPELDMLQGTCFLTTDTPTGDCSSSYVHHVLVTGESAYIRAAFEGDTVFASAGDWGADNSAVCVQFPVFPTCGFTSANPAYPSSSPWVTAVGGTMGNPYYLNSIPSCSGKTCSTGLVKFQNTASCQLNTMNPTSSAACTPVGYGGEQVWNEPLIGDATGGAPSLIFGLPFYQHDLGLKSRATPDVSYNAAVDGGVFGYWSAIPSAAGFYIFGGTSAGSPQWAAIAALADQLAAQQHRGPIGFINPTLYAIGNNPKLYQRDFHDITVGNNIVTGSPDKVGFSAGPGWDDASGWGTPNVANLVPDLVSLSFPFQPSS